VPERFVGLPPLYLQRHPKIGDWLAFEDDAVVVKSGKVELGQGVKTAFVTIAAEELCVAPERVRIAQADTEHTPNEDYTAGSFSISQGGGSIRAAAAAARSLLLEAAERAFGIAGRLTVVDGEVAGPGRRISYWSALSSADLGRHIADVGIRGAGMAVPQAVERIDLPAKLRGGGAFLQDLELPGLLYGRAIRPAGAPRSLEVFDDRRAQRTPHLVVIVRDGNFLGVVAEREESAIAAAEILEADCRWSTQADGLFSDDWLTKSAIRSEIAFERGESATPNVLKVVSATYKKPCIAHASIGPSCGVARSAADGKIEVWTHSQGIYPLRAEIAAATGVAAEMVLVRHVEGAGCYGHNGADDAAFDAVVLSRAVGGRPVKAQWSRADEFGNEPLGPAMEIGVEAGLDRAGRIVSWRHQVWSNGHTARPGRGQGYTLLAAAELAGATQLSPPMDPPLPFGGSLRNATPLYDIPNVTVVRNLVQDVPTRVSALRSLGAYANIFAIECFMDELAAAADEDPLAFRLAHLKDDRARAVLSRLGEQIDWGASRAAGNAFGIAFAQYKNIGAYCAAAAHVDAEAPLGLTKLTIVVDAGRVVCRDGLINQVEGGAMQAASWSLKEAVAAAGSARPASWSDYSILSFSEAPEVETIVIDRPDLPSAGVGECAQGPVGAAIANAFASGYAVRARELPITREKVLHILDQSGA
jgi:CO/xanthine dehydrogenase Mo-binding subunit